MFIGFLNSIVIPGDYGSLDVTVLSNAKELFYDKTILNDIFVTGISIIFIAAIYIKKQSHCLAKLLAVLSIAILIFTGYACIVNTDKYREITLSRNLLPEYNDKLWSHSKNGRNVIVFIFDMFTGGHIKEILANRPELTNQLDGFVWFPDTTSLSHVTVASMPSIYGGHAYEPDKINERSETELVEKIMESYSIMANAVAEEGFDVAYAGIPFYYEQLLKDKMQTFDKDLFLPDGYSSDYAPLWNNWTVRNNLITEQRQTNLSKYFIMISLFRLSPHSLRVSIYDEGAWHGQGMLGIQHGASKVIGEIATLQFLPELSNSDSKNNTFKIIYNKLSHYPWHLPPDVITIVDDPYAPTEGQLTLVDGLLPEHLYTEQHMILFLANYVDWLKEEGIYNNTRIIVVSDHDQADSSMLSNSFLGTKESGIASWGMGRVYPGRSHALLLLKDFEQKGPLHTSDQLMSTSDVPSLALAGVAKHKKIPGKNELFQLSSTDRIRKHFTLKASQLGKQEGTKYIFSSEYQITGTIFNKNNWQKIK